MTTNQNLPSVISDDTVDLVTMADAVAKAGLASKQSEAMAKIAIGRELGLSMMSSIQNIQIIKGKASFGYTLIGAMIRRHPDYDYEVVEHTAERCEIAFTYKGKPTGTSEFTIEDAEKAGLTGGDGNYKKYPRNMLLARAMSNGARWYAPDVFMGAVYTADELREGHADVDTGDTTEIVDADGQVIDVTDLQTPASPAPSPDAKVDAKTDAKAAIAEARDHFGEDTANTEIARLIDTAFPGKKFNDLDAAELERLADEIHGLTASRTPDGNQIEDAQFEEIVDEPTEAPQEAATDAQGDGPLLVTDEQLATLLKAAEDAGLTDDEARQIACHVAGVERRPDIPQSKLTEIHVAIAKAGVDKKDGTQ